MMADPNEIPSPADEMPRSEGAARPGLGGPEQRRPPRASSTALVTRESDRMRTGIEAVILDVGTGSLSLNANGPFAIGEPLKIKLRNVVQRFEKDARGLVRKSDTNARGSTILEIELLTRLSALEVSLVKMGIASSETESGPQWF